MAVDHWHVATIRNEVRPILLSTFYFLIFLFLSLFMGKRDSNISYKLTRQLLKLFPDLYDEIELTVADKLNQQTPDENGSLLYSNRESNLV